MNKHSTKGGDLCVVLGEKVGDFGVFNGLATFLDAGDRVAPRLI
jgi:hypothetical protein